MATPPPHRSVFSLLLRQLDAESLLGGGVQREGLGMFPGSSRFLEGRMEGGSMARAGGFGRGVLYGLSLGHWASGQGEAPIQSLVQPHSCGLQGPQPPPFRPVHPPFGWSQAPQTNGQGWLGFLLPSPPTGPGRLREGQDGDKQETGSGGETWSYGETPAQGGRQRQQTGTDVPAAQRKAGWGGGCDGGKGWLVT